MSSPSARKLPPMSEQSGFTIIQLVVMMGVIAVSISIVWQSRMNVMRAEKHVAAGTRFQDVDQLFANEIRAILQEFDATQCLRQNVINNRLLISDIGISDARIRYHTNIEQSVNNRIQSGSIIGEISNRSTLNEASRRCAQPRFIAAGQVTQAAQNQLYFCVEFSPDSRAPADSFLSSPHAFAEILINLVDLRSNAPMSCRQFVQQSFGGAQVFYSLYWLSELAGQSQYRRRNSVIYTAK